MKAILTIGLLVAVFCPSSSAMDEEVLKFRQERARMRGGAYLDEGKKELERGSYVRAIRLLSLAMRQDQGAEPLRLRGQAYFLSGMYAEAIEDISRAIGASPRDPLGYDLLGDVFLANGDHLTALENYENAIKVDPLYAEAYVGRALAYLSLEKYALAIQDLRRALQSTPKDQKLLSNLALTCLAADMPRAAEEFAKKIHTPNRRPELAKVFDKSANERFQASRFEERAGSVDEYIKKTAASYEGTAKFPALASAGKPGEHGPGLRATDRGQGPKTPGLASIQERNTRKIDPGQFTGTREFSGSWDGRYMGLKWSIDFKARGDTVSAVLKIYSPSGKEDVHYCDGVMRKDGTLEASDNQGFRFSGRLTDDYRIVGSLTKSDGKSIDVNMPLDQ